LSRVNRLFNETCTPFLYEELNLFDLRNEIDQEVITRYGKHVKILRVGLIINTSEVVLTNILSLCNNIHSIGLYYRKAPEQKGLDAQSPLLAEILSAIRDRGLRSIGFYSPMSYHVARAKNESSDQRLLYEIAQSDQAKLIKRLDVYFGGTPPETYPPLRTRFTGLEALSIRGSLNTSNGPIWSEEKKEPFWGPYSNLISLQLVNCHNIFPPHIAELIRHFPSLEHFLISACGHGPTTRPARGKGWSAQQDGWWNRRKPLKLMHIEHMLPWEMLVMGTIPALEIVAVGLYSGDLAEAFMGDHEIFPHLRLLRAEPLESKTFPDSRRRDREHDSEAGMKPVLDARKIEFRRDASWLIHTRYGWM
jgi:hypothetical protein